MKRGERDLIRSVNWRFPDAKRPTANQQKALSHLAYMASLEMRILGREGKAAQVTDLAEAFHNLPLMLWHDDFSISCQRESIVRYQTGHGVTDGLDYLAEFDRIAAITD
jgi:hypothetical protein